MGNLSKDQKLYLDGMAYAWKIVKAGGEKALEEEIRYRGLHEIPLNVNSKELTALARIRVREELEFVATSMAATMLEDLNLPLIIVKEYLVKFNNRIEVYRANPEVYQATQQKLNENVLLNKMAGDYLKEE